VSAGGLKQGLGLVWRGDSLDHVWNICTTLLGKGAHRGFVEGCTSVLGPTLTALSFVFLVAIGFAVLYFAVRAVRAVWTR